MEKKILDRIFDKISDFGNDINEIKVTQAEQKIILEEHMRRSLANEEAIEILRDEFKPIQTKATMLDGILRFVGGVALLLAAFESIKNLIS